MDAHEAFRQTVARTPDNDAVITPDRREVTYAELDERARALGVAFEEHVDTGRVATLLDNGIPMIDVMVTSVVRGVGHVPLNTREPAGRLEYVLADASARALVFDDANAETALELLPEVDVAFHAGEKELDVAADTPVIGYESALAEADGSAGRRGDEFGVFYTSGSTGRPKGVVVDTERMWYASSQATMEMGYRPDDVAMLVTPLFHLVTPAAWVLPHLQVGATLVPLAEFEPERTLDVMAARDATALFAVPAQHDALTAEQAAEPRDLSSLRHARTGGAPLGSELVDRIREELTPNLHNTYGLTESVANLTHAYPAAQNDNPGTVGKATYNWELRVVEAADPDEIPDVQAEVEPTKSGELLARGVCTVDGYLDRPDAEADLYVDGWLRTGDVAAVAEDGSLSIVDRIDNMIVSGGENVYPQEVETVLDQHPDVEENAVIGAPHPEWGTAVVAVVVGDVTGETLDEYCLERDDLANFKRPRAYRFTDDLPRSPIGKLRRGVIRDDFGRPVEDAD